MPGGLPRPRAKEEAPAGFGRGATRLEHRDVACALAL
jgi:hypothetical protein